MFINLLKISSGEKIIREINFRKGLNLIIDETPEKTNSAKTETGNNVGKTTVLQLIDFCLGANPKGIYVDPDSKKNEYVLVKDFLKNKEIIITLVLKQDLEVENSDEIIIERNFLSRSDIIRRINGHNYIEDEFEPTLLKLIFPNHSAQKPSFRQIISHNIRYKDESINSTLRTLDKFCSDVEYETLHLFMLGVDFDLGHDKLLIVEKLQ